MSSWQFAVQLFRDEYRVPLLDPVLAARIATGIELIARTVRAAF